MGMVPEVADLVAFFMGAIARSRSPGKLERQKHYEKDDDVATHSGKCISGPWPESYQHQAQCHLGSGSSVALFSLAHTIVHKACHNDQDDQNLGPHSLERRIYA